jgi:hypothetical protein
MARLGRGDGGVGTGDMLAIGKLDGILREARNRRSIARQGGCQAPQGAQAPRNARIVGIAFVERGAVETIGQPCRDRAAEIDRADMKARGDERAAIQRDDAFGGDLDRAPTGKPPARSALHLPARKVERDFTVEQVGGGKIDRPPVDLEPQQHRARTGDARIGRARIAGEALVIGDRAADIGVGQIGAGCDRELVGHALDPDESVGECEQRPRGGVFARRSAPDEPHRFQRLFDGRHNILTRGEGCSGLRSRCCFARNGIDVKVSIPFRGQRRVTDRENV